MVDNGLGGGGGVGGENFQSQPQLHAQLIYWQLSHYFLEYHKIGHIQSLSDEKINDIYLHQYIIHAYICISDAGFVRCS